MLFPLKSQRVNQQHALTMDSAKGKTGEKGCIFTMCGDETTIYDDRALKKDAANSGMRHAPFSMTF